MDITSITIHYKSKYAMVEYGYNPVMRAERLHTSLLMDFLPEEIAFIQKYTGTSKVTIYND